MSRSAALRDALDRCRQRVDYCQAQFTRFCSSFYPRGPVQIRQHRKISQDLERARADVKWAEGQLERVRAIAGMDL